MPQFSDYDFGLKNGYTSIDVSDLGEIKDANGNEALEIDAVASAVNYVRLANSATGNAPVLSAQGDDTNVGLTLTPKGTGLVAVGDSSTGTIAGGSATINAQRGTITTGSLTTGTATVYSFDLVNSKIGASSQVFVTLTNGTNTAGLPVPGVVDVGTAGSATIRIVNADSRPAGTALNGTLKVNFLVAS